MVWKIYLLYGNFRYGVWKDFRGSTHRTHIWYIVPWMVWDTVSITSSFLRTSSSKLCSPSAISATCFDMKFPLPKRFGASGPNRPSRCLEGGLVTTFSVAKLFMFVEVFVMGWFPWNLTIPVDAKKNPGLLILVMQFRFGTFLKAESANMWGQKGAFRSFHEGTHPPPKLKKNILWLAFYAWAITPLHPMGVFHSFPMANRQAIITRLGVFMDRTRTESFRVSCLNRYINPWAKGFGGSWRPNKWTKKGRFVKKLFLLRILRSSGWWFRFNPSEKYACQIGNLPQFSGWKSKIFETIT